MNRTRWIFLGIACGLGLGAVVAWAGPDAGWAVSAAAGSEAVGGLFLRLLKLVVVPLVATSIVSGVLGLGEGRRLGRLGFWTLAYYLASSLAAIVLGLVLVNLVRPGAGAMELRRAFELQGAAQGGAGTPAVPQAADLDTVRSPWGIVERMVPVNVFRAMAEGDALGVIFFSMIFGLAAYGLDPERRRTLATFFDAAFQAMMRLTQGILILAPVGVGALMVGVASKAGLDAFLPLAWYAAVVLAGLALHAAGTLGLALYFLARVSPAAHTRAMAPALLTAFGTASSSATLPVTLDCLENRAGVPNTVTSFVAPLGSTVNMDGTALYECVAVLFIAQVLGLGLDLSQQALVVLTALMVSVGAAGVPMAGLVMMGIILSAVGLPLEAWAIILPVDRFLDMFRTTVNVWSDSVGARLVARAVRTTSQNGGMS